MPEITMDSKALKESEILRRHILYQTSFTGSTPVPIRSISPLRRETIPRPRVIKKVKTSTTSQKLPVASNDKDQVKKVIRSASEVLDFRRQTRADRSRPWKEKAPKSSKKKEPLSMLFYDRVLPSYIDDSDIIVRPRRYVSNSKYGNIYELRRETPRKQEKAPPARKWLWEDEFLLWQKGTRGKYLEEVGNKTKTTSSSLTGSYAARGDNLPSINEHPQRPSAALYASYHHDRLDRTSRKLAATQLQKAFRGWHVRNLLKLLKRKALLEHGRPWIKFMADYRELVAKIQSRYGVTKTSCPTNLEKIAEFMDKKLKYERAFDQVAINGKLHKDDLMEFFNRCDLWPTQRDINRSFDTVFRGSRNTAEVVFLLDCSSSIGVIGFHSLIKLVKDIVLCLDIAPDRTRVGMVPYNEDVFSSFGINAFTEKNDLLAAISLIKLRHGLTRTDIALRLTREMFKDSRPGVQKIAIVISDGKSTDPAKTEAEGKIIHDLGVQVFTIGVGEKADMDELERLATSSDNFYKALDVRSLAHIRRQIEKRLCLSACGFCQHLLPRIQKIGLNKGEAIDLVWSVYPPAAAGIRPVQILQKLPLDDNIMRATGMKACLRLVVKAKLEKEGFIMVPSSVKEGVEKATSETQVMNVIENYIRKKKGFSFLREH